MKYEEYIDLFQYTRLKTRSVQIGNLEMGGNNPIRIQSMTSTNTLDTEKTIEQSLKIIKAGGELVRITAQGVKEAENLENIKEGIRDAGFDTPIAADIHFNPKAAYTAAKFVEKVRSNPGNFVDKRFDHAIEDFSDEQYQFELEKIEDQFVPLLNICKENRTALRIGVNHGSLSDRIMNRYGDTPEGMVESAMEFLRFCVQQDFLNVVVSLKSSNTRVMVQSNRLMLAKMNQEKMNFPLHLGVTEAGEGEDGRIKSAVGIGALLADGIGDTIRVSLTEAPEEEIPVAKKLVDHFKERESHKEIKAINEIPVNFFEYTKRKTNKVSNIGGDQSPIVIAKKESKNDLVPEFVYVGDQFVIDSSNVNSTFIIDESGWDQHIFHNDNVVPLFKSMNDFYFSENQSDRLNFLQINCNEINHENLQKIRNFKNLVLILETKHTNGFADQRAAFLRLLEDKCDIPVIIKITYKENTLEDLQLKAASDIGGLFLDGFGDGIWLENLGAVDEQDMINTSFGILQASRVRTSKTEYISCPGCGRTLFDLQHTTKEIREKTSHLKNLKIGIMGCIVNGPGEMADADYGYVGAGPGKITLYKNKEVVKKNIPEENAVEELIQLIKDNGDWPE
ncbi:MAG: 4-hydroxy-3-methylbut-2-en-1-yl diphosphate synthase [Marinilabiliales bacterium]|nr:MAG: 4-hydroxy-3-methylbut-2-en-1-yl diphosphate synthase [Marinilabiliales bacterium]